MLKVDIKRNWVNQNNLIVVDVSAVMRTKYLKMYTESEKRFMGSKAKYLRTLSYEVDGERVNTSSIFGLMQLFQMYGVNHDYIFCFDAPNNLLKKISRTYKNNRVKMGNDYFDQVNSVYRWLTDVGFRTMFLEGYEGDHHINKAVKDNYSNYDNIAIITNDKDLTHLVDEKVVWVDTLKKRTDITLDNYVDVLDCPYNMIILKKAMVGDNSDNIKGIHRFGDKSFQKYIVREEINPSDVRYNEREIIENSTTLKPEQIEQALLSLELVNPLEVPDSVESRAIPTDRINTILHKEYLRLYGIHSIDKLFNVEL